MTIKNHFIIGLGGSGGKIIKAFRKRIYEEYRHDDPVDENGEKLVNLAYLWVDSDAKDLNETISWKVLGHGVHLGMSDRLLITGVDANIIDNIHDYPNISPWLGDPNAFKDVLKGTIGAVVGGQRRRLGRLLFAYNAADRFCPAVKSHVHTLCSYSDDITFHICAGLAGGTGSGSIIDAIAQCRRMYPNSKILVYAQLPERNPGDGRDTTNNYHANGYAALTELNALSVGEYMPHDVSGTELDANGNVKRIVGPHTTAFNSCWVFGNEIQKLGTGGGKVMGVEVELPTAVSDFLFQKIVAADSIANGRLARISDAENGDGTPEMDGNTPVHSKRFSSFGIKRVEYPEAEIEEYATYVFARQVALQFQYNKFAEGLGFIEIPVAEIGMGQPALIEQNKAKLLIDDKYLTLSAKLEENAATRAWREIDELWIAVVERFATEAQRDADKKDWLSKTKKDCDLMFNQNYRSSAGQGGVMVFYKAQQDQIAAYASFIRRNIEKIVFSEWRSGKMSFIEAEKYVLNIIEYLKKRDEAYEKQINDRNTKLEQVIVPELKKSIDDWKNLFGFWGKVKDAIADNNQVIINDYKKNLREFYTNRTWIEAYKYAHDLNNRLCNELGKLGTEIRTIRDTVEASIKFFNESVGSKCQENYAMNVSDMVVKLYDTKEVHTTVDDYTREKKRQESTADAVRAAMVKISEDQEATTFAALNKMDVDSFLDIFISTCAVIASSTLSELKEEAHKMVNVNILEKIKFEYGREEKLERFLKELIESAGNFVRYNDKETRAKNSVPRMKTLTLVLPDYKEDENYRDLFIEKFANNVDNGAFDFNNSNVVTNYRDNQIVIISASSTMPLRYIDNMQMLREKFEARLISADAATNRLVLFTEGDGKTRPNIFNATVAETADSVLPKVLLGFAMGLFEDKEDPRTGGVAKAIGFPDEFGDKGDWIFCGKNIILSVDAISKMDKTLVEKIVNAVDATLKANYVHNTKKEELKQELIKVIKTQVLPLCPGGDIDEVYVKYKNVSKKIFANELKLA